MRKVKFRFLVKKELDRLHALGYVPAMVIAGFDPGLAAMGYAFVKVNPHGEQVLSLGVIRTQPGNKKRNLRQSDDVTRRVVEIVDAVDVLLAKHPPVIAVCSESFSPPRNASSAAKVAMAWGAVIGATSPPYLQASPQEIKIAVCGSKKASKEEIEKNLIEKYGECVEVWDETPEKQKNHGWDALTAIVACLSDPAIAIGRKSVNGSTAGDSSNSH